MSGLNVLISGAGIAGNVLAYWLLKSGATVTIVERDPQMRLTGQSIDIRGRAVDVIRHMNLEDAIRKLCTHEEGLQFVDDNGSSYAELLATGDTKVQSFTSEFEIFRGELSKLFYDQIDGRVTTLFGDYIQEVHHREGAKHPVEVVFARSKETRSYDLVVAADGLASKLRPMVFGLKNREEFHSLHAFAAFFTIKRDLLNGSRLAKWLTVSKGRSVLLRPDPAGNTRAFLCVVNSGEPSEDARYQTALKAGPKAFAKLMEEVFAGVGWLTPKVLEEMKSSEDFYASEIAQIKMDKLSKDRVVLVGDAGYCPSPMSGMGTTSAIVGAYLLAGELAARPDDVPAALARYEASMLPFARSAQQLMPGTPRLFNPQTEWGVTIFRWVLFAITWTRLDVLLQKVGSAFGESKWVLPDYKWAAPQQATVA